MSFDAQNAPVWVLAVVIILREVFSFLRQYHQNGRSKNGSRDEDIRAMRSQLTTIAAQVRWLYDAHAVSDQNGIPVWYVRRDTQLAITEIRTMIERQNTILRRIHDALTEMQEDLKTLSAKAESS